MELEPMPGFILIEPEDRQPRQTASGILIKEPKFEGAPIAGRIYAIAGSGIPEGYAELKVGDRVIFKEEAPKGFKFEGKSLFALKPEQIRARIDKDVELWG